MTIVNEKSKDEPPTGAEVAHAARVTRRHSALACLNVVDADLISASKRVHRAQSELGTARQLEAQLLERRVAAIEELTAALGVGGA